MRHRWAKMLIAVSLALAIAGPWALLQSLAWVGMAVSYSQDSPISEALKRTFDGHHPCQLCKVVQEGKKTEKKSEVLKPGTKVDYWVTSLTWFLPSEVLRPSFQPCTLPSSHSAEPPPIPPPRLA